VKVWATWLEGHDSVSLWGGAKPTPDHYDWYGQKRLGWVCAEFFKKAFGRLPSVTRPMRITIGQEASRAISK
jgi:hypothetical protein